MNVLGYQLRLVLTAIQYFTRLPVPRWVGYSDRQLNDASRYFPLVGILVGLFTGAVFLLAMRVFPQPIAVLLSMLAGVLLTGGFHEDGLADVCDGFGGGRDRPQILAIMKDSRVGSYGVLGLSLALLQIYRATALPVVQLPSLRARMLSVFHGGIADLHALRATTIAHAKPATQSLSRRIATRLAGAARLAGWQAWRVPVGAQYFHTGGCLGAVRQVMKSVFISRSRMDLT